MEARWVWDAECLDCSAEYSGFSGGADECPGCGSNNVIEYPDIDFWEDLGALDT